MQHVVTWLFFGWPLLILFFWPIVYIFWYLLILLPSRLLNPPRRGLLSDPQPSTDIAVGIGRRHS